MKPTSCTNVSAITTPGGTCEPVIFTPNANAGMSTMMPPSVASTSATISATGAVHPGHEGRPSPEPSAVAASIAYATQCHVANWPTKSAVINSAEATSSAAPRRGRRASQRARHMLSGNSTTM